MTHSQGLCPIPINSARLETMRRRINELQREALARPLDAPLPCVTTTQWNEDERMFYEASQIQ